MPSFSACAAIFRSAAATSSSWENALAQVTGSNVLKITWPARYLVSKTRQVCRTFPPLCSWHRCGGWGLAGGPCPDGSTGEYAALFPGKTLRADQFAPVDLLVRQVHNQPGHPRSA